MLRGEQFLDKKYQDLRASPPVEHEAKRRKKRGETEQKKPHEKIGDFLDVLKRTHGHHEDPRVLERIKAYYHKQHVIKPEDIPESYYQSQGELAVREGRADDLERAGITIETKTITNKRGDKIQKRVYNFPQEYKDRLAEVIIEDQQATLNNWVEYLSSPDADAYPMWAKYWAFRSMLGLSTFDKEKHRFNERRKDTVAPFPDLNREALAYVVDMIQNKVEGKDVQELAPDDPELQNVLKTEHFGKLYAHAIEKVTPAEEAELKDTRGEWIMYPKGSDHMPLVESIQGHGTGWCTAGASTAKSQLEHGDFYVFYSLDKDGNPTIPRAAIRMEGDRIAEVRGIAHEQNLDPNIIPVVEKKLKDFGEEGERYKKRSMDMKKLTAIERAMNEGKPLDTSPLFSSEAEALKFLYEIDTKIEGFGYQSDPRIQELRSRRDPETDMPIVFECEAHQIAKKPEHITEDTRVYVGPLERGIFRTLEQYNIEHIYTAFPERPIKRRHLKIGGKTKDELTREMQAKKIWISPWAKDIMNQSDFTTSPEPQELNLIELSVRDLGFPIGATVKDIYAKAKELGLKPVPPETGLHFRLAYTDQPEDEWILIGMNPITDSDGNPFVFYVSCDEGGLRLHDYWAKPDRHWGADDQVVFRPSK